MIEALLAGALFGLGVYALIRVFLRPAPGLATLVARIDRGQKSMQTHTLTEYDAAFAGLSGRTRGALAGLADRIEAVVAERGWQFTRQRSDLAILNRSIGALLALKIVLGLGFFLLAPVLWGLLRVLGVDGPAQIPLALALVLGALGFLVPDAALRSEAAARRKEMRRTVGIFLDLVAMNLTGGRGLPEALLSASTISDHWSVIRIRQALANARLFGTTPWAALGDLGKEVGLDELRDLSATLGLAADDGAKIRLSLSARAATIRRKELADAEGEEGEKSQSMLVAQLLIVVALLLYLVYPAVVKLMTA